MASSVSGSRATALYGYETSDGAIGSAEAYGTLSPDIDKSFGNGVSITVRARNNLHRSMGIGSRNAQSIVPLSYAGTVRVEGELAGGHIWHLVTGSTAEGGGGGPTYVHTHTEANVMKPITIEDKIPTDTASVTRLLGCVARELVISSRINEVVKFAFEFLYKTDSETTSSSNSDSTTARDSLTFAHGTINVGGTIANVQSFILTILQNTELRWGHNSRFATSHVENGRLYDFALTVDYQAAATLRQLLWGASSGPDADGADNQSTVTITLANGSGSSTNNHVITLANLKFDDYDLPQNVEQTVEITLTGWAKSLTSVAVTDGSSTTP